MYLYNKTFDDFYNYKNIINAKIQITYNTIEVIAYAIVFFYNQQCVGRYYKHTLICDENYRDIINEELDNIINELKEMGYEI